jgi:hypothetical protein
MFGDHNKKLDDSKGINVILFYLNHFLKGMFQNATIKIHSITSFHCINLLKIKNCI